jgi:hypothetical protein
MRQLEIFEVEPFITWLAVQWQRGTAEEWPTLLETVDLLLALPSAKQIELVGQFRQSQKAEQLNLPLAD